MTKIPRIISVDDHVVESPDLWVARAPAAMRDRVPRVERSMAVTGEWTANGWQFVEDCDHPDAKPTDVWVYEGTRLLVTRGFAAVGVDRLDLDTSPLTYEDMIPGCYEQAARLVDMDRNHTEASVCFPTIARFCGQFFLGRDDQSMALECIRIYNDWMIDEWCGGPGRGRLIPNTLIPLWDPLLAAAEVRRCADKGSHSIAFSEAPHELGLPSMYSGEWDVLWRDCQDTDTVVNMHIGSSSKMPRTADDAPHAVSTCLFWVNGMKAVVDWIMSGTFERFPGLRITTSESQAGWLPFVMERMDKVWERNEAIDRVHDRVPQLPSSYVPGRVFECIFDDLSGLRERDAIGIEQILFETDYPHADSTWPDSVAIASKLFDEAGLSEHEAALVLRGNAIRAFGLDRYFGIDAAG